jgi:ligand-binding SRPBCC domain-containing protein
MDFHYECDQWVPAPLDRVFDFFTRAENHERITPQWLNFRIISIEPPGPVRGGTRLLYALRWRVFPIRWTTEITVWHPPHQFADVQLRGPYRKWEHEHRFVAENGGTRIYDRVTYALPFGILGALAHRLRVRRDVESIFAFRRSVIERQFPSEDAA